MERELVELLKSHAALTGDGDSERGSAGRGVSEETANGAHNWKDMAAKGCVALTAVNVNDCVASPCPTTFVVATTRLPTASGAPLRGGAVVGACAYTDSATRSVRVRRSRRGKGRTSSMVLDRRELRTFIMAARRWAMKKDMQWRKDVCRAYSAQGIDPSTCKNRSEDGGPRRLHCCRG